MFGNPALGSRYLSLNKSQKSSLQPQCSERVTRDPISSLYCAQTKSQEQKKMTTECDWIVLIPDHEGALEKRMAARPAHLDGLSPRVKSGKWTMGGATLAKPSVEGQQKEFNGSCIVAHAASKEEVLEEVRKDIYATSGVWNLDKIIIHPLATAFRKELAGAAW
ncbi:uncharacterized protein E0L32_006979 [Thyridium curvatum]|uniref:YCII-related domain-containing protein n=1 Tax=Thyridium curvatum TaxID=1093900 RepID=A0A507AQS3_9PEZI|nr:uncharacterized protein E0L32_006979 [Thyridium curvatum]TPX12332.1 hypothetical protein E0L32_006979 [Thyridium curvatum]